VPTHHATKVAGVIFTLEELLTGMRPPVNKKVALLRKKNSNILFLPFLFGYIIGPLKNRIVNLLKLILRVQLCLYENIQGRNGKDSLRVLSNFGDGDCGVDEIHTRARNFEETRREGSAEN